MSKGFESLASISGKDTSSSAVEGSITVDGKSLAEIQQENQVEDRLQVGGPFVADFEVTPKNFYWHEPEINGQKIEYWQCGFQVDGGYFNFHIHGRKETKRKDVFRAKFTVWERTNKDGRTFIYIDLEPTEDELTHVLRRCRNRKTMPSDLPEDVAVFYGTGSNRGCISFSPIWN